MNVNNQSFNFGNASIFMLGRNVTGIAGFSFKPDQETSLNFGAGNQPVSIGKGRKTVEGSLTLYAYEVVALERAVGQGKSLTDIPAFDVVTTYGDNPVDMTSIVLKSCVISGYEWNNDNSTTEDTVEVSLVIAGLEVQ